MRVTVIGHSTLFIETGGPTVLVDPWLAGSVAWRSWWHFPPSVPARPEWLAPDYVYLTHHHPDHFHYPSMRRLDRGTTVLIPHFGVDVMADELRGLGFDRVRELPHGEREVLAPEVWVASYQYGFDDTVFVVHAGGQGLVDFNDCKMRGRALQQVARDVGRPALLFKAHSFAQGYPHCYEAEDPADLALISRETYTQDFIDVARVLRPRFAVPFGSMVAFLHPESRHVNAHLVTPSEVVRAFAARGDGGDTEVVTMAPGDRWDDEAGFTRSDFDWYADRERHLDELAREIEPTLARTAAEEAQRTLRWEDFRDYIGQFLRALPPLAGRALVRRPIAFEVPSASEPYWHVDLVRRRVWRAAEPDPGRAAVIRIPEGVLADAMAKRIVHFVHGSMRFHTRLQPGGVNEDLPFWGLLAIWEIGYLPLRGLLRPRFFATLWRRRREAGEALATLAGRGSPLRRLSRAFASERDARQ